MVAGLSNKLLGGASELGLWALHGIERELGLTAGQWNTRRCSHASVKAE